MDDLTFLSGCVLAGALASPREFLDREAEAHSTVRRMVALAVQHLHRLAAQAEEQPQDHEGRLADAVALSERDAIAKLTAIIQAVDAAGDWPTEEARADADVVAWVCEAAREMRHLRQQRSQQVDPIVAGLKARQVRLLSALKRAEEFSVQVCGHCNLATGHGLDLARDARELIELIDLLKLECKTDEDADG